MRARPRLTTLGLGLAFALIAGFAPARAGFDATVAGFATPVGGGLTLYTYVVTDLPTSTNNVGQFSLSVNAGADISVSPTSAPAGYLVDYTPGNILISFDSPDPSIDLTPGSFETFSFTSRYSPGLTGYSMLDYNDYSTATGTVVGPTVAPEPGSLVLLGVGLPFAVAMLARRRSRKPPGSPVGPA